MFPLWDDVPAQRIPFVNYAIIVACVLAFAVQLQASKGDDRVVREFGMIPLRVTHPNAKMAVLEGRDEQGPYQSPMEDGMVHFHEFVRRELFKA